MTEFTEPPTVKPTASVIRPENLRIGMIFKTRDRIYKVNGMPWKSDTGSSYFVPTIARRRGKVVPNGLIIVPADRVCEAREDWNRPFRKGRS